MQARIKRRPAMRNGLCLKNSFLVLTPPRSPRSAGSGTRRAGSRRPARSPIVGMTGGIPHVYGKTDRRCRSSACFTPQAGGRLQPRSRRNYIVRWAALAESQGGRAIYRDLRMKLFIQTRFALRQQYAASGLVEAADGRSSRTA